MAKKTKTVKTLKESQIRKIYKLTNKGLSQRAVAEKIGVSQSTVFYWLHKASW